MTMPMGPMMTSALRQGHPQGVLPGGALGGASLKHCRRGDTVGADGGQLTGQSLGENFLDNLLADAASLTVYHSHIHSSSSSHLGRLFRRIGRVRL